MSKKAEVIQIRPFAKQLMNPHRYHLAQESNEKRSWEWLLRQFGRQNDSLRLIQWVFSHPVTLLEPEGSRFVSKSVSLAEILRRENLRREDLLHVWEKTFVGPYCSLLRHLQNQRQAIRMVSMMWFSPVLSEAYDYQELFQSYCDFLLVVSSLFEDFRARSRFNKEQISIIADQLWRVEISMPLLRTKSGKFDGSMEPVSVLNLSNQAMSKKRFNEIISTCLAFVPIEFVKCPDSKLAQNDDYLFLALQWLSTLLCNALSDWACPANYYETSMGARGPRDIYGDFETFFEYRALDSCLRKALHI